MTPETVALEDLTQTRAGEDTPVAVAVDLAIVPDSWNLEARTVEVRFATDAVILRRAGHPLRRDEVWREQLVFEPGAVDLARVNAGRAHALDAHHKGRCADVVGSSVPGSARLEAGAVYATIKFRNTAAAMSLFMSIGDGSFTNWSMRYLSGDHRPVKNDRGQVLYYRAYAWTVLTIDPVPVAADWRAGVREAQPTQTRDFQDHQGGTMTNQPSQTPTQPSAAATGAARALELTELARECDASADMALAAIRGEMDTTQARAFFDSLQGLDRKPEPKPEPEAANPPTEAARCLAISQAVRAADLPGDLADQMILDGATVDQARAAILERKAAHSYTPKPTAAYTDNDNLKAMERALEDAMVIRTGGTVDKPTRESQRMAEGHILEGVRSVLDKGGVDVRGMEHADLVRSATTTGTFDVLGNRVVSRRIVEIYKQTTRPYADFVEINDQIRDFNPVHVDTVENDVRLNKIGENQDTGDNTGVTLEDTDSYQLDHYTGSIKISYRAWLVDDIRRIATQLNAAADAAVRTERGLVINPLIQNTPLFGKPGEPKTVPLFHGNHGNIHTAAAITPEAVRDAEQKMFLQRTQAGRVLETRANYILCSKTREQKFIRLFANTTPRNPEDVNVLTAGNDRIDGWIVLPEIDFSQTPGINPDTYFLVSRPTGMLKTVEIGYLRGNRNIEVFKSDWDDNRNLVYKFDFKVGVKYLSYKGFVRVDKAGN